MQYKLLGNTGLRVSELCLGAMTFGEDWEWGANRETSQAMFEAFAEAGGNFIDTANVYTNGTSEKMLGEFVGAERDRFVIATKYTVMMNPNDPNSSGNQRKNLMRSLEASLKRLNTDYIDLYWVHMWDTVTPVEEMMRALDDVVRSGKVMYVGISDALAWIRHQSPRHMPIIGARNLDHLKDNLGCLNVTLNNDQLIRLNAASEVDPGFALKFLRRLQNLFLGAATETLDLSLHSVSRLVLDRK